MIDYREHGASNQQIEVVQEVKVQSPKLRHKQESRSPRTFKKPVVISNEGKHYRRDEQIKPWSKGFATNEGFIKTFMEISSYNDNTDEPSKRDETLTIDMSKLTKTQNADN